MSLDQHTHNFVRFQEYGETIIEIPHEELDRIYVEKFVLTNTDRFLEEPITGTLRMWHLIVMVSGAVTIASNKRLAYI